MPSTSRWQLELKSEDFPPCLTSFSTTGTLYSALLPLLPKTLTYLSGSAHFPTEPNVFELLHRNLRHFIWNTHFDFSFTSVFFDPLALSTFPPSLQTLGLPLFQATADSKPDSFFDALPPHLTQLSLLFLISSTWKSHQITSFPSTLVSLTLTCPPDDLNFFEQLPLCLRTLEIHHEYTVPSDGKLALLPRTLIRLRLEGVTLDNGDICSLPPNLKHLTVSTLSPDVTPDQLSHLPHRIRSFSVLFGMPRFLQSLLENQTGLQLWTAHFALFPPIPAFLLDSSGLIAWNHMSTGLLYQLLLKSDPYWTTERRYMQRRDFAFQIFGAKFQTTGSRFVC